LTEIAGFIKILKERIVKQIQDLKQSMEYFMIAGSIFG